MNGLTAGFIGSGRVAAFMLEGFAHAEKGVNVILADIDPSVSALRSSFFAFARDAGNDFSAAAGADIVFLALHPPALPAGAALISPHLSRDAIVVSLSPKIDISTLSGILKTDRIARFNPNAASAIGAGYNPVVYSPSLSQADRLKVSGLLSSLGGVVEIREADLASYAVLGAMGPTYLWPIFDEMIVLGAEFGLTEEASLHLISHMAAGSAAMIEAGKSHAALMDMVPVKPMGADEGKIRELFRTDLGAIFSKLNA